MILNAGEVLRKIKIALASRYLFDNWVSLLLRDYALSKIGISTKLKAKIGSCISEIEQGALEFLLSLFSRGLIKDVRCVDGKISINHVLVDNINEVFSSIENMAKVLSWRFDTSCNCWVKNGIKFKRIYYPIIEIFELGIYRDLNVRNRVVLDVGGYVGDSAIYFIWKGAQKVIAIEPHPEFSKRCSII